MSAKGVAPRRVLRVERIPTGWTYAILAVAVLIATVGVVNGDRITVLSAMVALCLSWHSCRLEIR